MNEINVKFIITNFITLLRVVGIFALIPVYKTYGGLATFILSSLCFFTDFIDGFFSKNMENINIFRKLI